MAATQQGRNKPIYTQEKAIHLFQTFTVTLSIFGLIGWLHVTLLTFLNQERKEMAHMDPSIIKGLNYSLKKLTLFVMGPITVVMGFWLWKTPDKMMTNLFKLTRMTMIVYALMGMCGSYIVTDWQHSLTAALYVATLVSTTWKIDYSAPQKQNVAVGTILKASRPSQMSASNVLDDLPLYDFDGMNMFGCCRLYGMLLVSIPFQILSVLDHGIQVQRWPLPIVLGTTYGYVIGSMLGMVFRYFQRQNKEKASKQ